MKFTFSLTLAAFSLICTTFSAPHPSSNIVGNENNLEAVANPTAVAANSPDELPRTRRQLAQFDQFQDLYFAEPSGRVKVPPKVVKAAQQVALNIFETLGSKWGLWRRSLASPEPVQGRFWGLIASIVAPVVIDYAVKKLKKGGRTAEPFYDEMNDSEDRFCPCFYNYQPVCATNGKTYSNKCLADCEDAVILHMGVCMETTDVMFPFFY